LSSPKYEELLKTIKFLSQNGGILIFLDNDNSNTSKDYGIGAQILNHFGVKDIELLSSNKNKEFVSLAGFGLNIVGYKEI